MILEENGGVGSELNGSIDLFTCQRAFESSIRKNSKAASGYKNRAPSHPNIGPIAIIKASLRISRCVEKVATDGS